MKPCSHEASWAGVTHYDMWKWLLVTLSRVSSWLVPAYCHVWHDSLCDKAHFYVSCDCVTRLMCMCNKTYLYVWQDSFSYVLGFIYESHDSHEKKSNHDSFLARTYIATCHDSFLCVTQFYVWHVNSLKIGPSNFLKNSIYALECGVSCVREPGNKVDRASSKKKIVLFWKI